MKTITCDKCGITVPMQVAVDQTRRNNILVAPFDWLHNVLHEYGPDIGQVIDLCPLCKAALMVWIQSGGKNG